MASTKNNPRAHALGPALRQVRQEKGLNQPQAAKAVGLKDHSHISRIETGVYVPNSEFVSSLLTAYGVFDDEHREKILRLAREASDPNWAAPGVDPQLAALMEYERKAARIYNGEPTMIPGLLQTRDYAAETMRLTGVGSGVAQQRVAMRMGRRDILTRAKNPVEFEAFVSEHALRRSIADREILCDQLYEIEKLAQLPNVRLWVIPDTAGYTFVSTGSFVLIEFDNGVDPVLQTEGYRGSTTIVDKQDTADYKKAIEELRTNALADDPAVHKLALRPEESIQLIKNIISEMESQK